MHDFTDFRRANFTKFEHNTSIGVAMNPFETEYIYEKKSRFPNGISIGSAVFAGLTTVTDR